MVQPLTLFLRLFRLLGLCRLEVTGVVDLAQRSEVTHEVGPHHMVLQLSV